LIVTHRIAALDVIKIYAAINLSVVAEAWRNILSIAQAEKGNDKHCRQNR